MPLGIPVLPARRDFGFRRAAVLAVSRIHGQLLAEMETDVRVA
jgi:hypothetical protein